MVLNVLRLLVVQENIQVDTCLKMCKVRNQIDICNFFVCVKRKHEVVFQGQTENSGH